jgi:membrane-bound lytic murein transglycosylase B
MASVDGKGSLDTRGLAFPVKYKTPALTAAPTTTVLAKVRRAVFPDGSLLMVWSYAAKTTAVPRTILMASITRESIFGVYGRWIKHFSIKSRS